MVVVLAYFLTHLQSPQTYDAFAFLYVYLDRPAGHSLSTSEPLFQLALSAMVALDSR